MSNIPKVYCQTSEEFNDGDNQDYKDLCNINETLKRDGYFYVKVLVGDYLGSIAKFTAIKTYERMYLHTFSGYINLKYYWGGGRLSWEGKRNNPKFRVMNGTCEILFGYEGPTVFQRRDIKKEKETLIENSILHDIDGNVLSVGDEVVYINLRYGCGGKLCKGIIKEFKPNVCVSGGFMSAVIKRSDEEEESELKYPDNQIYLLNKGGLL